MSTAQISMADFNPDRTEELVPPPVFKYFAIAGLSGGLLTIILAIILGQDGSTIFNFKEGGVVTVLSSIVLSMASVLALLIFYLKSAKWSFGNLFWLGVSAGLFFLAADEHLQFHEKLGWFIGTTDVGEAEFFRNWNDLVVILYGVVALIGFAMFGREIIKCRTFAILLATAFAFYAISTGIDSTVSSSVAWKDIPEESAKLFSVIFMLLAISAQLLAMLEQLTARNKYRKHS